MRSAGGILVLCLAFLLTSRAERRQADGPLRIPARNFYVAPDGQKGADGSIEFPLPLGVALSRESPARPGDTIWMRGGTYHGGFVSALNGRAWAPITVRAQPGEHVVIDSAPLQAAGISVMGSWTEFRDFEVTNSDTLRKVTEGGSWPSGLRRAGGIDAHGAHNKFINLVLHDLSDGMGLWAEAEGSTAYGNVIFYNGWEGPDRSHGHGIYTQNKVGVREIEDNIIFNQFSHGIHAYGSSAAYLDNIALRGNIVFGNGSIAESGGERDILVGGGRVARNPVVEDNVTYGQEQSNIGYVAGCDLGSIARNYFSGLTALILESCKPQMTGNVFVGATGFPASEYPNNRYFPTRPQGHVSFVRPNRYDRSRVHIAIYNWDREMSVPVDLSSALTDGAKFEVIDVQDYFGPPVLTGTYEAGTPVEIPMQGHRVTPTVGTVTRAPRHTDVEFGAFVLRVLADTTPAKR